MRSRGGLRPFTCWSTGRYSCCTLLAPEKTGMRARVFSAR
eukprot:COSAG04_NODE_26014_length_300_cov_1.278607_1_plen_39_part_10